MKYLGLDIGNKRTGVAYADDNDGILFSLETIVHADAPALIEKVSAIAAEKKIDQIVIGLPLLLSGAEGEQSRSVRAIGDTLAGNGHNVRYIDERYSTVERKGQDSDSASACSILSVILKS